MHEITKYGDRRGTTFLGQICDLFLLRVARRTLWSEDDEQARRKTRVASSRCYRLEKRNRGKGTDEEKK